MGDEIFRPHAELYGDALLLRRGSRERLLQIAAVDRPIGSAITLIGVGKRHAYNLAAAGGAEHADRGRRRRHRTQPVREAEIDQNSGSVGRKLNACAGFLEPLGLLQHHNPEAVAG